jgi:hypothetical protein
MTTENEDPPTKIISWGTPEEIAAIRQQRIDEAIEKVTEGPAAHHFQAGAQAMHAMLSPEAKADEVSCGLRSLAVQLLGNLEDFRTRDPYVMNGMLATQASLLNTLFNRSLENAGLDNKESFSVQKANVALQAQKQCKILLEFMTKLHERY